MSDSDDIMPPPEGGNPFPAIRDSIVGAGLVKTTNARDLHGFLKVGRDFTTWIKARLDRYGFVENVDYVTDEPGPQIGGVGNRGARTEYHLTLDTAKEIAMVENNEQGRAARRYFIECERRAQEGSLPTDAMALLVQTNGIARQLSGRLAKMRAELDALVEKNPVPALDFGGTVTAHQMIVMAGIPAEDRQRGTAQMVTRRMISFCAEKRVACFRTPAEVNPSRPFRFSKECAGEWLLGDRCGVQRIRNQVERMKAKKGSAARGSRQMHMQLVTSEGRPVA